MDGNGVFPGPGPGPSGRVSAEMRDRPALQTSRWAATFRETAYTNVDVELVAFDPCDCSMAC